MSYLFDEIYGKDEEAPAIQDKILLMGLQAAGKTAIKDVVFFNKSPDDMQDYMATVHYQRHFIDEEKSSMVIDSGGQEAYWNEAVTHFRHLVFSDVKLLIWIVDVTHPEMFEESERRFSFTIRQYKKENPNGRITVLCHKVDLVPPERMVVIHQHIRDSFDDPKYDIDFENTSIYYGESLKELVFTIMAEAGIDVKRFELISNLGQKVEESDEFQSYLLEHQEDPRIAQLLDFLKPEAEITLPTFGKLDLKFDLTDYGIVEIVLIDKETFSPIVGASSRTNVSTQNSMDYLIALHDFKSFIKEKSEEIEQTGTIVESQSGKVHGMVFNLVKNYLLISSFSEITEDRKERFFELIFQFAKSTADSAEKTAAVPEPTPEIIQPKPVTPPVRELRETPTKIESAIESSGPAAEDVPEIDVAPEIESEAIITEGETEEKPELVVPPVPTIPKEAEPPTIEIMESSIEVEEVATPEPMEEVMVEEESILPPSPAPVELVVEEKLLETEDVEIEPMEIDPVPEEVELPETHVESQPIIVEKTPEPISEPAPQVPVPSVPLSTTVPAVPDSQRQQPEVPPEEKIVPEIVEKMVVESISPEIEVAEIITEPQPSEPIATLNGIGDSSGISFSADDIKGFANFLVQKKETILDEVSPDAIKEMSEFLTKGPTEGETEKEIKEETQEE